MENTEQKDSWVVEVEESLKGEIRADKSPDGLIHKVPESLLSEKTKVFYHPQVISLGPYHFIRKEKLDDEMELLKSEVARKVHHEIIAGFKSTEKVESHTLSQILKMEKMEKKKETYVKSESGLNSVMYSFRSKEEQIKKSYDRKFEVTGEVCAWMITRDACFVLQVLEKFDGEDTEKNVTASIDRILSRKRHHPLLTEIVKDMLKMENQLPFWVLEEIRPDIVYWFESALKNLSPIEVAAVGHSREYNKTYHILQLLHVYIVDRQRITFFYTDSDKSIGESIFLFITQCVCACICFCSICRQRQWDCLLMPRWLFWEGIKELFRILVYGIILLVLSPVLFIMFIIFAIKDYLSPKWERGEYVPTVEELKRLGVKFKRLEGDKKGISHIEFKESNSTLYLPQFKVDNRSEVILRNLIALEICSQETEKISSQETEKPITRYVILMNDLINTSGDVGILRREGIINSKLGSDEEIVQFWNSMAISTEVPSYKPIDDAVSSIDDYRKKWWKVLWARFIISYCSKLWLSLSLLGGQILLLLTFVQVFCLFASCQIK